MAGGRTKTCIISPITFIHSTGHQTNKTCTRRMWNIICPCLLWLLGVRYGITRSIVTQKTTPKHLKALTQAGPLADLNGTGLISRSSSDAFNGRCPLPKRLMTTLSTFRTKVTMSWVALGRLQMRAAIPKLSKSITISAKFLASQSSQARASWLKILTALDGKIRLRLLGATSMSCKEW